MRIALLLNNWGTWGGTAVYHLAMVNAFREMGIEVKVAIPFAQELWKIPSNLGASVGYESSIKALQACSHWIVWGIGKRLSLTRFLARKRTRPMVICINHGGGSNKWSVANMVAESPYADRIVGVSEDSLNAIPLAHRHKASVIFGAVDRDRLQPTVSAKHMRSALGLSTEAKVVLYFGRLAKEKGIDDAIEAMRYMPREWKLLLVGGSTGVSIDPAVFYDNFSIQFCSPTLHPGNYLQIADCTIHPSKSEGFGLSVVESIVFGRPTVAHRVGILNECDLATTVDLPCSPRHYARAILKASADSEKSSSDQQRAIEMFSVEQFSEKWKAIL